MALSNEKLRAWATGTKFEKYINNMVMLKKMYYENNVSHSITEWYDGGKIELNVVIVKKFERKKPLMLCVHCGKGAKNCECGGDETDFEEKKTASYSAIDAMYQGEDEDVAMITVQFSPFKEYDNYELEKNEEYKIKGEMGSYAPKDKTYKQITIETVTKVDNDFKPSEVKKSDVPDDVMGNVKSLMDMHMEDGRMPLDRFKSCTGAHMESVLKELNLKVNGDVVEASE